MIILIRVKRIQRSINENQFRLATTQIVYSHNIIKKKRDI